ncbi:GFA family protein [Caulobacter sp. DWR1-3-2b1]|uniref:GFA family protein n=1 Tax=Caulobacter sp. DWR1-3-2b1 TaxID=2804670 RepID=UPI003CECABA1
MPKAQPRPKTAKASAVPVHRQCVCGAVKLEIDVPARWAWHDHSAASRHAHGAAYATYVGSYRSRFRILEGAEALTRFEDAPAGMIRSFCGRCGTPMLYERKRAPTIVNIPRALFVERTGREARYHTALEEAPDWAYAGEPLAPLKGYPGVMWERPRRKPKRQVDDWSDVV